MNLQKHYENCIEVAARVAKTSRIIHPDGRIAFRMNVQEPDYSDVCELLAISARFKSDVGIHGRRKVVRQALSEFAKEADEKKLTPEMLKQKLLEAEKAYRSKRKQRFFLHTQISINTRTALPNRIAGKNAEFRFYRNRPKGAPEYEEFGSGIKAIRIHEPQRDWYYAKVFVDSWDEFEAADLAFRAIHLLRASWNLESNRPFHSRNQSPVSTPINQFRLGPIQTVHTAKRNLDLRFFWYQQPFVSTDYPGAGWQPSPNLLKEMRLTEKWILKRIARCKYHDFIESNLINYVNALDHAIHVDAFPKLWIVAESLTCCGLDGKMDYDKLVKRACNVFAGQHEKKLILEHLRHVRNEMVHRQSEEFDDTSLFQLIRIVHALLRFHLRTCNYFASLEEVAKYLDLPREIDKLRRSIKLSKFALRGLIKDEEEDRRLAKLEAT